MATSNFTSTSAATIAAQNVFRHSLQIYNEGAGTLHVLLGSGTVSTTNYTAKVPAGALYEVPADYVGIVTGIFAAAGTARVTEVQRGGG